MRRDAAQTKTADDSAATFGLASRRKSGRIAIELSIFFCAPQAFFSEIGDFSHFFAKF